MSDWQVGDTVIIEERNWYRGPATVSTETITKVARKYFYVRTGAYNETAFEIATGREKNNGTNYHAHAHTPDGYAAMQFRNGVLGKIREHNVNWGYQGTWREADWSTGHLCELLTLLERVKAAGVPTEAQEADK